TLAVDGLPPADLLRPDGAPIAVGQVQQGEVCEVMYAAGHFILISSPDVGCPTGFVRINDHYCMEATSSAATTFYEAVDICALKGAKLCTWDEYQAGCYWHEPEFVNLHIDWEWINDTSNHTHGADQVARTTCRGIRTRLVTIPARTRCCYHLR
ncbi:MAG TPA: hypothetical protein PK760_09680, partial [Flavobacteriales bacterium]|nr:hypothetical protein [Flavobacteriales bacterium]